MMKLSKIIFSIFLVSLLSYHTAFAEKKVKTAKKRNSTKVPKKATYHASVPKPTLSNIAYGTHPKHVLDFWKAESEKPTPLVFVIHGGGWKGGSKERLDRFADAKKLLEAEISVIAINYRLMAHTKGVVPPVKAPLTDAARALQFVRSKAKEWNVDSNRIGAAGGSAGGCSSLWLAYHDEMADPKSEDPIARYSTRLTCVAAQGPQTTLDPKQMKEWTPNSNYGGHAFGKKNFAEFLADREKILPWIKKYSPYSLVSKDDPSVCMFYSRAPEIGKEQKDPTHTANFGLKLKEHCESLGLECILIYSQLKDKKYNTPTEYLIDVLKK